MRKIDALLAEYGESHQNATNKMIHWVCVPVIYATIAGFLWSIPSDMFQYYLGSGAFNNWATVISIIVVIYYCFLSIRLAVGMAAFTCGVLYLIRWVDVTFSTPLWLICLIVFVLAWIGQFYGHKVEGKKPSFFKDIQFLMVGPAWLMHFLFKKAGLKY